MTHSYNLLDQPWLPCVDLEGRMQQRSLQEVLLKAHEIREIRADLPVTTGALYLFLIAFAGAVFRPQNDQDWQTLWENKAFPKKPILAYIDKWVDRFDLFHPEHPFYQDPKLGKRAKDLKSLKKDQQPVPKGISGLLLHLASGSNATLFDHHQDRIPSVYTAAEAARLLVMMQAYSLGGMSSAAIPKDRYFKDSSFGRGILFLNQGQTLFETLLLNLIPQDYPDGIGSDEDDLPAWEQEDPFSAERPTPLGILDLLTWQSRRILLIPEEERGSVVLRACYPAPGQALVETFPNPFYHIFVDNSGKKESFSPLRFRLDRRFWRDSAAILDLETKTSKPALPVRWAKHLWSRRLIKTEHVQLTLFGMCTQPGQKKAYFYARESFMVPLVYLSDSLKLFDLRQGLDLAEQVKSALSSALWDLARFKLAPALDLKDGHKPDKKDVRNLFDHWGGMPEYWRQLEPAFYQFLTMLPESDGAWDRWKDDLRRAARQALTLAAQQVGTDPAALKARAKAEKTLNGRLYETLDSAE